MKRFTILFFSIFFAVITTTHAQSGHAGPLTWRITGGTLTISGSGAMPNYTNTIIFAMRAPWHPYRNSITAVVVGNGVTHIGNFAFNDLGMKNK